MCLRKSRVTWPVSTQVSRLLPDPHSRLCAMNVAHLDLIINQRGSENFYRVSLLFGNVYMYKQGGVTYSICKPIFSFSGIECPQGYLGDITGGNIRTGIVSLFWAQAWDNQPYRELALIREMFADCLIRSSNSELLGFPGGSVVMNPPASAGDAGDTGSVSGSGRSPGGGHGNPLQYSCLGNPMDRGAWWATVCGVTKESDTTEHTRACNSEL